MPPCPRPTLPNVLATWALGCAALALSGAGPDAAQAQVAVAASGPAPAFAAGSATVPSTAPSTAPDDAALLGQVEQLARLGASQSATPGARLEIVLGKLDPRLRLAPCQRIEPYLPTGVPVWGSTRVGLRCTQGEKAWNVSLPVSVKVWATALVAGSPLPTGTVLAASNLKEAVVDLAAAPGAALRELNLAVGRTLSHPVAEGAALRQTDLKARQWFAAGETVRVVAIGPGWRVETAGYAVSAGIEGQPASIRTDAGRLIKGRPSGEREVEVTL